MHVKIGHQSTSTKHVVDGFVFGRKILRALNFDMQPDFFDKINMIRNYLKVALRNLRKKAGYTLVNIIGLTTGITSR